MTTCSESSRAAAEPLAGSAVSDTRFWLGIEVRSPWPARIEDAAFPEAARAAIDGFSAQDGTRVQLLRRPARTGPLRIVFADTTPGAERRHAFEIPAHDDLAGIDLDGLITGTAGARVEGPEVWVCTHAQRDACCGLHGGRVFAALSRTLGEAVWQTSHLGGHRFAPTLLWLPHGLSFGRVDEPAPFADAALRGEVYDPMRLRGRCAWPEPVQSAEIAYRRLTGWKRLDAPPLLGVEEGPEWVVRFEGAAFRVREEPVPSVIPSCGKAEREERAWVSESV